MKSLRGPLDSNCSNNDNLRIRRYIAKYTINPAIANGLSQFVGSVEVRKESASCCLFSAAVSLTLSDISSKQLK